MITTRRTRCVLAALLAVLGPSAAQAQWDPVGLGFLGVPEEGPPGSRALLVNEAGVVAGWSYADGATLPYTVHSFAWTKEGGMVDVTPCSTDGTVAVPETLNRVGQIGGFDQCAPVWGYLVTPLDTDGDGVGDVWFRDEDEDGRNDLQQTFTPVEWCDVTFVNDVNDAGRVVGNGCGRIFYWSEESGLEVLAQIAGGGSGRVHINERGQVASSYVVASGEPERLLLWSPELGVQDLGGIPGTTSLRVADFNDDGWILFSGPSLPPFLLIPEDTDGDGVGDLWYRDDAPADGVNDLFMALAWAGSGTALNERGAAVGVVPGAAGDQSFWWAEGLLEPFAWGWPANFAEAVNDLGQVAVSSYDAATNGVWSMNTGFDALPGFRGGAPYVEDLSPGAVAVGVSTLLSGLQVATLWLPDPLVQLENVRGELHRCFEEYGSPGLEQLMDHLDRTTRHFVEGRETAGCAGVQALGARLAALERSRRLAAEEVSLLVGGLSGLCW